MQAPSHAHHSYAADISTIATAAAVAAAVTAIEFTVANGKQLRKFCMTPLYSWVLDGGSGSSWTTQRRTSKNATVPLQTVTTTSLFLPSLLSLSLPCLFKSWPGHLLARLPHSFPLHSPLPSISPLSVTYIPIISFFHSNTRLHPNRQNGTISSKRRTQ